MLETCTGTITSSTLECTGFWSDWSGRLEGGIEESAIANRNLFIVVHSRVLIEVPSADCYPNMQFPADRHEYGDEQALSSESVGDGSVRRTGQGRDCSETHYSGRTGGWTGVKGSMGFGRGRGVPFGRSSFSKT